MGDLTEVHPVAIARAALIADERIQAILAPGVGDRVGPDNEPPYPRLVITDPPGDDRALDHLIAPLLQIEAIGDLDGTPGKPALRKLLYTALIVLKEIPTRPVTAGEPVVTEIGSSGGGGWSPYPNGQGRYLATVRMYVHPGRPVATP